MSLAALSSKLYTIKSRKNLPLSAAFTSMIREDLAMRYSVFNIVKSITGSELIATIAQAKYGKRTPIEREEQRLENKKISADKKFKQFTVNSLVSLNNKINMLNALTERNLTLIENLYRDLGNFKNQKKFTKNDLNHKATKTPLRSRTVKYQIDEIREQLLAIQKINLNNNLSKKSKQKILNSAGVAGVIGAGGDKSISEQNKTKSDAQQEKDGSLFDTAIDIYTGYTLAKTAKTVYRFLRRKFIPTPSNVTATPVATPGTQATSAVKAPAPATTTPTKPIDRMRSPVSSSATAARVQQGMPSTRFKLAPWIRRLPIPLGNALFRVGQVLGTGPQAVGLIIGGAGYMASGKAGEKTLNQMQEIAKKFGIKFLRSKDGTPIYEINGEQYTSEELPPEYQTILDAYIGDTRSASSVSARERIAAAPALYNSLVVEGPPITQETDVLSIIARAKATELSIKKPEMISGESLFPETSQPQISEQTKIPPVQPSFDTPKILPLVSYAPGKEVDKETVKQIIVQAANIVGVEPGIMLAMGQQESGFNPNAKPYIRDKKTGEMKLLSSAKGLFQFIDKTWAEMLDKYSKDYPELLRGPMDPMANALAGALYVKQNSKELRKNKIPITGTSIYATHFLGSGGATKLFSASPNASAVSVLPAAAASNPHIFYENYGKPESRARTISEVIDVLYKKVGSKAESYTAELNRGNIKPLPTATPGMGVAVPPPVMVASTTQMPSSAEVQAAASLVVSRSIQDTVVGLAGRISDLDKQVNLDSPFPSVRNSAAV